MALTDESNGNGFYMPVAPAYMGGGYGNGGFGGFGGDWGWIILLLLCCGGGWGGFGGFGGMGGFGGAMWDFPWLINGQQQISNNTNDGFRDAQLHDSVTSVRDGVSNLATQLCNCCGDMQMSIANSTAGIQNSLCSGFAGVNASINGAQNAISNQLYNNEIASLNRSFAEQTANTAGFNGVQSSLCDIRYGNATNTRDILTALTAGVQSIKDQLCQDKIDAKNDEISALRQQVAMKDLAASQTAQNAFISHGFANEVDALYNRLNSCPVPTTPVYGRTPIFTCNNGGCGCGCGNGFAN